MQSTSPYAVPENEPPNWRPGEEIGASIFVGMSLFLIFETLFGIIRLFRKREGLYYWSMLLGTIGCAVDSLGVILKYLVPHRNAWGFYTLCLLSGWTTYSLAQLLVLYSRLHLVNQNVKVQRFILVIILSTILIAIIPTWIVVWPAYDTNTKISSLWSPRDAIVERYVFLDANTSCRALTHFNDQIYPDRLYDRGALCFRCIHSLFDSTTSL